MHFWQDLKSSQISTIHSFLTLIYALILSISNILLCKTYNLMFLSIVSGFLSRIYKALHIKLNVHNKI